MRKVGATSEEQNIPYASPNELPRGLALGSGTPPRDPDEEEEEEDEEDIIVTQSTSAVCSCPQGLQRGTYRAISVVDPVSNGRDRSSLMAVHYRVQVLAKNI